MEYSAKNPPMKKDPSSIAKEFISAKGEYISGEILSKQFGLSRVGLRQKIELLKTDGFSFSAVRKLGYRLEGLPKLPSKYAFFAEIAELSVDCTPVFFDSVDSTNLRALALAAESPENAFAVFAAAQTKGRAACGAKWRSQKKSFALSCSLSLMRAVKNKSQLSEKLAKKAVGVLQKNSPLKLRAQKNAVYLNDEKLCGVLCEFLSEGDFVSSLSAGIGVNYAALTDVNPNVLAANLAEVFFGNLRSLK